MSPALEERFQTAKQKCGLDDYQVVSGCSPETLRTMADHRCRVRTPLEGTSTRLKSETAATPNGTDTSPWP